MQLEVKTYVEHAQKKQNSTTTGSMVKVIYSPLAHLSLKRISEDGGEKVERWTIAGRVHS